MGSCSSIKNKTAVIKREGLKSNSSTSSSILQHLESRVIIDKISKYTKYDDVNKYYTFGINKGFGSFGIVREATSKETGKNYAIKTVWKAQFADKKKFILQEIEILLMVDHENIIKCYQVYEDQTCIHFVFDLIEGGDLFEYLTSVPNNLIPDSRAVDFFNQILEALMYLHEKGIVHRDIKPENFLIYHDRNKLKLKLIDFGFATQIKEGELLDDKLGSLHYISPEILKGENYDTKVDMWAAGVILYNMLTGSNPFLGKDEEDLINNIKTAEVQFPEKYFKNENSKNLIIHLLDKNYNKRFSANSSKLSSWIQNYINIDIQPTVYDHKFDPNQATIKNILILLDQQSTIKEEIWNMCLTDLKIDVINNSIDKLDEMQKRFYPEESTNYPTIGGKEIISYNILLKTILECNLNDLKFSQKILGD